MSYLDHGRYRTVGTPFEIDNQIHIRLAINGVPHEAFVLPRHAWDEMVATAPDESTLLMSLAPYAEFSSEMKRAPTQTVEKYSAVPGADVGTMPKWMEEAAEIWGLNTQHGSQR